MGYRRLSARERRTVGMSRTLKRYTDEPPGTNPLDKSRILTRREMIASCQVEELERRKVDALPPTPQKKKRPYKRREWPKPGYKIINGKRVYPSDHPSNPEKKVKSSAMSVAPNYREIRLDEGLPPSVQRSTPQIAPREPMLIDFEDKVPKIAVDDFTVLSGAINILTRQYDELKERMDSLESAPMNADTHRILLLTLRSRCMDAAFSGSTDLRNFARSLVDQIDSLSPDIAQARGST